MLLIGEKKDARPVTPCTFICTQARVTEETDGYDKLAIENEKDGFIGDEMIVLLLLMVIILIVVVVLTIGITTSIGE